MQDKNDATDVEINVLSMVRAMAKELVDPPIDQLDDDAVETCTMIDRYIRNKDVLEYGIDVTRNGCVTVSTIGRDGATVNFDFEL